MQVKSIADYPANRLTFISQVEGPRQLAYADTEGFASIGIGFNLHDSFVRGTVFGTLMLDHPGKGEVNYLHALVPVLSSTYTGKFATTDLTKAIGAVSVPTGATAFSLTTFEMGTLFSSLVVHYEGILAKRLTAPDSYEKLALLSMTYNNPDLVGKGIIKAIGADDRAEAWYEIRYASNLKHDQGLENRRYYESDMFGITLSHDPLSADGMSLAEATQILQMRSRHITKIDALNALYHEPTDHYADPLVLVNNSEDIFDTAREKLNTEFGTHHTEVIFDYHARDANGNYLSNEINILTTTDYQNHDLSGGCIFLAGQGNNLVRGTDFGDDYFTGRGKDTVYGGDGDDVFHDSQGADSLFGGKGNDTYILQSLDPLTMIGEGKNDVNFFDGGFDTLVLNSGKELVIDGSQIDGIETVRFTGKLPVNATLILTTSLHAGEFYQGISVVEFGAAGGVIDLQTRFDSGDPLLHRMDVEMGKGVDLIVIDGSFLTGSDDFAYLTINNQFQSGIDQIDLRSTGATGFLVDGARPDAPGIYVEVSSSDATFRAAAFVYKFEVVGDFGVVAVKDILDIDFLALNQPLSTSDFLI